jgi:ankyrin repeat protein
MTMNQGAVLLDPVSTGLLVSARFGFAKLTKLELEMGARMDVEFGPEKLTPSILASMGGHTDTLQLLLRYDLIEESRLGPGDDLLLLVYAIASGHNETVKLLLDQRSQNTDLDDYDGILTATKDIPLHISFQHACEICGALETVYEVMFQSTYLRQSKII